MLLLETPSDAGGLQVFADHLSSTTFHYLPGSPRIVRREGRPGVQLLRYRAPKAGGLLLIDVDLTHDAAALAAGHDFLTRRHPTVDLVPVTFRAGSVRLVALGTESNAGATAGASQSFLVERAIGSATPALFGGARAIFSVALSAEGAALIYQTLKDGSLPVIVLYELTFEGLRLARGARASVQFAMAYDFLRGRLRADALVSKGDLDSETEALQRAGLVSISDVDYQGTDPATLARRAEELRTELVMLVESMFFKPSVSASTLAGAAGTPASAFDSQWARAGRGGAAFVLRELSQRETGTLTYDLTVSRVAARTIAPQGALAALARNDVSILDVDAEAVGPRSVTVMVPRGADWSGVDAVEVTFEQNLAPVGTVVVAPARTEGTTVIPARGETRYRTLVLTRPEPDGLGTASSQKSASRPMVADYLVVDPAALTARRVVTIALDHTTLGARLTARGTLDAAGRSRPFALDAARPTVSVPVWGSEAVECALSVQLDRDIVVSERRAVPPSERLVLAGVPPGRHQLVVVEFADPTNRLESVFVELEDGNGQRRLVTVNASTPRATWSGARDPTRAPYRWSARTVTKTGRSTESNWRDGAGSLLVVGDTDVRVSLIELVIVGAPANSVGAQLVITALAPPVGIDSTLNVVLEPPFTTQVAVPFRRDSPQLTYSVEGTVFLENGDISIGPIESSDQVCLLSVAPQQ